MNKKTGSSGIRIEHITLLVLFLALWWMLQVSSTRSLLGEYQSADRQSDLVRRVAKEMVKPGDNVILSTKSDELNNDLADKGTSVYRFNPLKMTDFDARLIQVLDKYCRSDQTTDLPTTYFVWTLDSQNTIMELSEAARELNFYFKFQAVLPYAGSDAFVIDKILRLQPKEKLFQRYCEINRISGTVPVMVIIDGKDFSPWIGSVKTGRITWLASDPIRQLENSDYVVIDMPPLSTYDVYWLGQLYARPSWSFENQDTAAYKQAVEQTKAQNGIVLVDQSIKAGVVADRFIKECADKPDIPESKLFRPMCIK